MRDAWAVAAAFALLTVAMTWPLTIVAARSLPDYGDPLYVCWALAWVARWIGRVVTEGPAAAGSLWDANILTPETHSLALSDHFFAQGLFAAPLYWATRNPILVANVSALSTFVLSGLGGYLLVRELTASRWAGVIAGAVLAFNPFRLVFEITHLQVLSSHWMPFVLYGLRRHLDSGRLRPLVGAALAAIALHASAGYYLVMFPPFVLLYIVCELAGRGRGRDARAWLRVGVWALAIAVLTWPFVQPYVEMQQRVQFARRLDEVAATAARLDGYVAALPGLLVPVALALFAWLPRADQSRTMRAVRLWAVVTLVVALWLSLGPVPQWGTRAYPALGAYRWLYDYVPGFTAVRTPSRYAVIFACGLAVMAGYGAARLARLARLWRHAVLGTLVAIFLASQWPGPLTLDASLASPELAEPPSYLRPQAAPPEIYRFVRTLPADAVIVEFPFSDLWYNARFTYATTYHWRRTLNGFTSVYPPAVVRRMAVLRHPLAWPDDARREMAAAGATHALVHERAWPTDDGVRISEWLRETGAREVASRDGARLFQLGGGAGGPVGR